MIEKAGSRVELSTWPTTLVLSASAGEGQSAALVDQATGLVTPLTRDGDEWSVALDLLEGETDVVVYRADDPAVESGPDRWCISLSGRTFEVERTDRSHAAVILMTLYVRNGRRLARVMGDGYAFGIEAYARSRKMDRAAFARMQPRGPVPPAAPRPVKGGAQRGHVLQGQGSGVSVAPGLVVTNHHVVDGVGRLVLVHQGHRSDAHVVLHDEQHDMALVRHDLTDLDHVAHRDTGESHLGEEILAAGFPLAQVLGDDLKLTYGDVSGLRGGGDVTRIQFTAPIASGSSGGALLDMSGRLVGLVSAALRHSAFSGHDVASENVNFAVKASLVREMLVAAGCGVLPYAPAHALGRAALAQLARRCIVSVDCYGS